MNNNINEHKIVACGCGDPTHHLIFTLDFENPEVWLHYQLELQPWRKRLWLGIKYIFGFQSKYGMYGELLIDKDNVDILQKIVKHVNEFKNNG